jgi:hypothetical protein
MVIDAVTAPNNEKTDMIPGNVEIVSFWVWLRPALSKVDTSHHEDEVAHLGNQLLPSEALDRFYPASSIYRPEVANAESFAKEFLPESAGQEPFGWQAFGTRFTHGLTDEVGAVIGPEVHRLDGSLWEALGHVDSCPSPDSPVCDSGAQNSIEIAIRVSSFRYDENSVRLALSGESL